MLLTGAHHADMDVLPPQNLSWVQLSADRRKPPRRQSGSPAGDRDAGALRRVTSKRSAWAAPTISSTCTPDPEQSFPDPSRAERVGTVECSGSASNLLGSYPQGRTGRPRSQQEGPVRAAE